MRSRRSTDPADADFRERREHRRPILHSVDGHTRWIVGFVSMAIIATLGTLVGLDRANIAQTADVALATALVNDKNIEVLATDVGGRLSRLQEDVKEIKDLLKNQSR